MTMDYRTFCLINGPLIIFNTVANIFFIFCMVCPLGERIKQPLKLLLGCMIGYTVTYLMTATVLNFCNKQHTTNNLHFILVWYVAFTWSLKASVTTSVWLYFFYYTQIVPAQRAVFIWIKKNIKPIIYSILLVERIYGLIDCGLIILRYKMATNLSFGGSSNNLTMNLGMIFVQPQSPVYVIALYTLAAHFILCACVMAISSSSTVVYLCRHMLRMVANGHPLTCPRFMGQVRVTVTGSLQGVLYMLCAGWAMFNLIHGQYPIMLSNLYLNLTAINVYMSGTMFNLAAGQSVFRQRAADIWVRAAHCCKVQQSEQGG